MKKIFIFLSLSLFLVVNVNATDLKEGLWEMTSKMEMKGMPLHMTAQKFKQCITKERSVPMETEKGDTKCKVIEQKVKGDTIFWKIICNDKEGETIVTGKGTYKNDKFEGETKIKTPDGMELKQQITGKWIGKCK